jgi:uncharacterized protein
MSSPLPLTSAELDRLSAALADDRLPDAMPLDAAQGMLYAINSGPEPLVEADTWLPQVVGDTPGWTSDAERDDITALLARFAGDCARDLMTADESLPIILFGDDDEPDYATWCQGYLDGVDAAGDRWFEEGEAEAVDVMLHPFRVLADELPPEERAAMTDREWRAEQRAARDDLVGAVLDLWHYWFDRRIAREPVRRETPKIGRNDPCHCGSGRKFKQCHGKDI